MRLLGSYGQQFAALTFIEKHQLIANVAQAALGVAGVLVSAFLLQATVVFSETQLALQHRAFLEAENDRNMQRLIDANRAFNLSQYGQPKVPEVEHPDAANSFLKTPR